MLLVWPEHDQSREWLLFVVPEGRTTVLGHELWAQSFEDNLVTATNNIIVLGIRDEAPPLPNQLHAVRKDSVRDLVAEAKDEDLRVPERFRETYRVCEVRAVLSLAWVNGKAMPAELSYVGAHLGNDLFLFHAV